MWFQRLFLFLVTVCHVLIDWTGRLFTRIIWAAFPESLSLKWFRFFGYHGDGGDELFAACGLQRDHYRAVTSDGYVLNLQRISKIGTDDQLRSERQAVLCIHGFLQDSDSFICGLKDSLAYKLVTDGEYDVWLGNNRGNKYSKCHVHLSPSDEEFWDFCIDDLGRYDVVAMVDVVRRTKTDELAQSHDRTGGHGESDAVPPKVALIGFSQGSAQVFAALSTHDSETLAKKVSLFVALAPALQVPCIDEALFHQHVMKPCPKTFFDTVFGRKCAMEFTLFFQRVLPISLYTSFVRFVMKFLFDWDCREISYERQLQMFRHIYSTGSTKCIHHWYQISRKGQLCQFDHSRSMPHSARRVNGGDRRSRSTCSETANPETSKVYDLRRIRKRSCPIALFCGGRDTIIQTDNLFNGSTDLTCRNRDDIDLLEEGPTASDSSSGVSSSPLLSSANVVACVNVAEYEHLCLIWADTANEKVFQPIISLIRAH